MRGPRRSGACASRPALLLLAAVALLTLPALADAAGRPAYGGTLRVALDGPLRALGPTEAESPAELLAASLLHEAPLRRTADGLAPVLLASVPVSDDGGRTFRLEPAAGRTFHDGSPVDAPALAAALLRAAPAAGLPLVAARVVDGAVLVTLDPPFPRLPDALAELACAPVAADGAAGAGPFRLAERPSPGELRLAAFEGHALGRPFLAGVRLQGAADVAAAGRLGAALAPGAASSLPVAPRLASFLFAAPGRPDAAALLAAARADVPAAEVLRYFSRAGSRPPPAAPAPAPGPLADGALRLLFDPAVDGHRALAERLQLKLHDRGLAVSLVPLGGAKLLDRTRAGDYELALVRLRLPADPALAAALPLLASGRAPAARALLASTATTAREAIPAALATLPQDGVLGLGRAAIELGPLAAIEARAAADPAALAPALDGVTLPRAQR